MIWCFKDSLLLIFSPVLLAIRSKESSGLPSNNGWTSPADRFWFSNPQPWVSVFVVLRASSTKGRGRGRGRFRVVSLTIGLCVIEILLSDGFTDVAISLRLFRCPGLPLLSLAPA
ncbi:hypothetical protein NE237_020626 [Protea cynaroides]|uniref:Secreted protein n=1 Tax=Protea cynaroides TaxID=273540 RepID=A0A9Q0H8S1_9MAGN|nr:hypothetical protein NE237_020626 [Protea cynaroides]